MDGLTDGELVRCPNAQCNSIGWLLWHLARTEDALVSRAQEAQQLWIEEGWHEKLGMAPDPENNGYAHSVEQVSSFKVPSKDILQAYWVAMEEHVRRYFKSLRPGDLDQPTAFFWDDRTVPLSKFLNQVVYEAVTHGGQIAYLRGMHRGMGWYE